MTQPIRPKDIVSAKTAVTPDEVIQSFNEEIARKWDGRESLIYQDDIKTIIAGKMNLDSVRPFDMEWLNIEPIYRAVGWVVYYDKPGYNEAGRAFFRFKRFGT